MEPQPSDSGIGGDATTVECPLILRLLETMDRLDPEKLEQLWDAQSNHEGSFEESVVQSGLANESQIAAAYAEHYLLPLFDPPADQPSPVDLSVAEWLPATLCRKHMLVPIDQDGFTIDVAIASPEALLLADEVRVLSGRKMRAFFAPLTTIERLLDVLYDPAETETEENWSSEWGDFEELEPLPPLAFHDESDESPPSRWSEPELDDQGLERLAADYLSELFEQVFQLGATDVHLEPLAEGGRVRSRVAGELRTEKSPSKLLFAAVQSRLKQLAKLDTQRSDVPQSGTLTVQSKDHRVEVLLQTCPTLHGEKLTLNVPVVNRPPRDLKDLGLTARQTTDLNAALDQGRGLILVTGPQGSGKTNTLYACLRHLNDARTNISSIESTITFPVDGINQLALHSQPELSLLDALQTFLRQQTDVLMAGELGDSATAQACAKASLAGHLVLSSLGSRDALAALQELRQRGLSPCLLARSLEAIVAQRLVRKLCVDCCEPYRLEETRFATYGIPQGSVLLRAVGCEACADTGYQGRVGTFEVIRMTDELRRQIGGDAPRDALRKAILSSGAKRLTHNALQLVATGVTSLEEALRAITNPQG